MTRTVNCTNVNRIAVAQSADFYYYFTKVCFAGLYFASHSTESVRLESPKRDF